MSCAAVSPAATTCSAVRSPTRSATRPPPRSASLLNLFSAKPSTSSRAEPASAILLVPRNHVPSRNSIFIFRVAGRYNPQPRPRRGIISVFRRLILLALTATVSTQISTAFVSEAHAQTQPPPQVALPISQPIPGRLLILYRNHSVPANADALVRSAGARALHHFTHLGVSALSVAPADEPRALAQLRANPQVAVVLHDRYVTAHSIYFSRVPLALPLDAGDPTTSGDG